MQSSAAVLALFRSEELWKVSLTREFPSVASLKIERERGLPVRPLLVRFASGSL
ncbi:hypothetical protein M9Y82_13515 [Leptospira weilii]|nr:hypothetical protein [Leptospira weilii]